MRLMRKVARRTLLNLAEAKRFSILNEQFSPAYATAQPNMWTVRNVFSVIPNPAASLAVTNASWTRVGSEIVDPLLKLKFTCRVNWANFGQVGGGGYGPIYFNLMLVATTDQLANPSTVSFYDFTASGDPGWFINPEGSKPTMNGNNVKVLKRWRRKLTPDQVGYPVVSGQATSVSVIGAQETTGTLTYRWKRKLTYEDATPSAAPNFPSGNTLRGWNYYILAGWWVSSGTNVISGSRPTINVDSFLYFKDP